MTFPERRDRVLVHVIALVTIAQDERGAVSARQLTRRHSHDLDDGFQVARKRKLLYDINEQLHAWTAARRIARRRPGVATQGGDQHRRIVFEHVVACTGRKARSNVGIASAAGAYDDRHFGTGGLRVFDSLLRAVARQSVVHDHGIEAAGRERLREFRCSRHVREMHIDALHVHGALDKESVTGIVVEMKDS